MKSLIKKIAKLQLVTKLRDGAAAVPSARLAVVLVSVTLPTV